MLGGVVSAACFFIDDTPHRMEMDMNANTKMMSDTNTTTQAERLAALSPRDLCQHVRCMSETVDYYERSHRGYSGANDESFRQAKDVLERALAEQRRRYMLVDLITYPFVTVETSFKYIELRDATWTAYVTGRYADGRNGVLCGVNASTGKHERFDWAHLDKSHPRWPDGVTHFGLATCG